jgi:hypothetical protein
MKKCPDPGSSVIVNKNSHEHNYHRTLRNMDKFIPYGTYET